MTVKESGPTVMSTPPYTVFSIHMLITIKYLETNPLSYQRCMGN